MKIGIIGSGNEMLTLFKFLNKFDHEYFVVYDHLYWPYQDKEFDFVRNRIFDNIKFVVEKGVDKIILPAVWEMYFLNEKNFEYKEMILTLFCDYLNDYCFSYSLIGKIGLAGDRVDKDNSQKLIKKISENYNLSNNQKNIKKFHFPFKFWFKEVRLWKFFLINYSYSNFMVNKTVKFDLRYFKDAGIDTFVPLNYGFFNYQNTISKYFNKIRFHKMKNLENIFDKYRFKKSKYGVFVFYTGNIEFFKRDKKFLRLLQRGKNIDLKFIGKD